MLGKEDVYDGNRDHYVVTEVGANVKDNERDYNKEYKEY